MNCLYKIIYINIITNIIIFIHLSIENLTFYEFGNEAQNKSQASINIKYNNIEIHIQEI